MVQDPVGGRGLRAAAGAAILFGLLTVLSGGRAWFDPSAGGEEVPFVVWFNYGAGFAYVLAGVGLLAREPWAVWLAGAIAVATTGVFGAVGIHLLLGGDCGSRTIAAMMLRTVVWQAITIMAWRGALAAGERRRAPF
jgi:hypothetical protein